MTLVCVCVCVCALTSLFHAFTDVIQNSELADSAPEVGGAGTIRGGAFLSSYLAQEIRAMSAKSTKNLDLVVGRLEGLLVQSAEKLDQALLEFERRGFSKVTLINHPMQKHSGRTLVHLAAGNNCNTCLDLLLKYQGRIDECN